ncbi:unnamed protein product [Mytilus edulis]|uniref:Chitin-binding type-2 domain-containing protein n=1 Tax=Mytilus edulis TaxID=6550 RepID=A0A8S3U6Z4_MYTED|nr:unnamed protein product [Mytilus edulis]
MILTNYRNGSIIVNYFIYFISTANQQVTSNAVSTTLTAHLTVSGSQLGTLVFITSTIIVHDVVTETLESPPVVEQIVTTTTVQSTIETTTKENVPSTETTPASKTVQQTEATTLVTMQSTMETTSLTILSTKETILNTKQSTAEQSTPEQSTEETTDTGTPTMTSTGGTTAKTIQPATETTTPSITSPRETTSKTVQSTTETTTPSITTPGETTPKTVQSTTETTTPSITSPRDTTPKTVQSTTETTTPSITTPGETTPKTVQSTTETTTPSSTTPGETPPNTVQSTTETTTPSSSSTGETTLKDMQSTTDITTPSITSIGETTPKTVQSTTATTNPSIVAIDETTTTNMQSTKGTTTLSILLTEKSTPKTMQPTTETTVPSISSTKETTPTSMQSKTSSPSISSTEESQQKTLQSTRETTLSSISTTLEPISNQPTRRVSEETTQQTFKTTEGTSTSIETEISTTQDKTSNKDSTITTPVKVTSPFIDSTIKETSKSPITYKTPEMTTSSVTSKTAYDSTTSIATMLNDKSTTTSITQPTTKTVTVTDYISPTMIDVTTRTTHIPFLSETTSPVSAANTEVQSTITQNKETTTYVALTDQTNASVKVSTITDTTALTEDMTSTTSEDENTVSTGRIDTSSDKTSPVKITTSEVPSSKETTSTLGNVPTTTPAYEPSSDATSTSIKPSSAELNCTDAVETDLYSGPVTIECTIKKSEEIEYIGISHENGIANTMYGVMFYKNGTIFKINNDNQDITITVDSTSTINLIITFINVTCTMDGSYKVALISNNSGEMNEIIGENVLLKIRSPTGKPTVTLSADQVIDLVFPDGNYYRGSGIHTCEGLVGEPPAKLEIDITYNNGTSFEPISNSSIDLVSRTNTSDECSTKETLSFGLKFSQEMNGARLRCRVSDSLTEYTLSEELNLIPRNICDCSASSSYRGHPSNCKVQVYCVTEGGIAYPSGIACASNQCRNSITGVCSDECSDTVCNETVPSDFCTTPAPPTTTPAPSPYIFCTDTAATVNSGPTVITCHFNDTATFTVLNVTYSKLGESASQQIASIDNSDIVDMFAMTDIVSITMSNYIINITILNPSCENEGTFAVVTYINGESVMAQGKFSVISKPNGDATLQLHPDQIAGLEKYRPSFLHTCKINVGYPPGEISIEILKQGATEFQTLNVDFHTHSDTVDNTTCSITRTAPFGILFTSDMDKATIRCSVSHDLIPNDELVYSNNETVSLVPIDFCKNNTEARSYHPHPTNCDSFVQCEAALTYSKPCPSGQCFGVFETDGCNYCNQVTCPADITTTPVPDSTVTTAVIEKSTTPEATFSNDVNCNSSTVVWNSGPVDMECKVNSSIFSFLNVTYRTSAQSVPTVISVIQSNGNVNDLNLDDGITVNYVDQLVTISILNASCSSGDFYGVIVENMNGNVDGKAEGKLIVGSSPTNDAILKLHPDQIAGLGTYRSHHPHICEANIGYPEGDIKIEILKQGETEFQVLDVVIKETENTDSACSITQKFSFGIIFTNNMEEATLRCRVKSNLFPDEPLIYSNNETVSLIPNDFCDGTNDGFNPHITNCHSYIQCVGNVEYGKPCQSNLCFGIYQTSGCDYCYSAICPSEITTASTPETTVPVPSIDVSCSESTVLINTGPGVIVCSFNATSFAMMNVTFRTSLGLNPTIIAVIQGNGNVESTNNTDIYVVTYSSFTVTISVLNVTCAHEGYFGVIIDSGSDLKGKSEGKLTTLALPIGPLDIILHPDQIVDIPSPRTYNLHTCSGQVGSPVGEIEVEILFDGSNDFQTFVPSHTALTPNTENCMVTQVFQFFIAYTSSMYNATIRCKLTNKEFPDVPAIYSKNETLALVPYDFCNINYNGTNSYPNPLDPCNKYVNCNEKIPYGKACPLGTCFNPDPGFCDHCYNVDSCP